jgi:hypothetical protein
MKVCMATSWKPDPAFVEHFARRRELFIAGLAGATASLSSVTCKPIDDDFTFGWAFEQGHTNYPLQEEGGVEFGLNYLRHMIDQGFRVAYAISLMNGGTVHLQAWESPHHPKPWPDDPEMVVTSTWHPMTVPPRLH